MTTDPPQAHPEAIDPFRPKQLTTQRLEAFSDGVIAVIITIMVLEVKVPARELSDHDGLWHVIPMLVIYALSFVQIGIYWVNHHYMVEEFKRVSHGVLWANLGFLFALSLIPFATAWVGERGITTFAVSLYALSCVFPALFWTVLAKIAIPQDERSTASAKLKQFVSFSLYLGALPVSRYAPVGALCMIAAGAALWLFPARRT